MEFPFFYCIQQQAASVDRCGQVSGNEFTGSSSAVVVEFLVVDQSVVCIRVKTHRVMDLPFLGVCRHRRNRRGDNKNFSHSLSLSIHIYIYM